MKTLFVTRKYPPIKGGMEAYSYNLITNYNGEYKALTLGKSQKHLVWFLPYCVLYVLINAGKFDVIELGDMLMSLVGWVAKKRNRKIKVVATIHGLDITYANVFYKIYLKLFSYKFDYYVPNSGCTKDIAEKMRYFPCKVIPPATLSQENIIFPVANKESFCAEYRIPPESFIVITVGRLVRRKGVKWFIENVVRELKISSLHYFVIGEGDMKEEIKEAIEGVGVKNVHMLGKVSDEELKRLYVNADVFLMPNILVENDVEGYGMVAVEAGAAGCLVVAAAIQGILDAVKNGANGLLFESENSEQLKEILEDIYNNMYKYDEIRKNAPKYVMENCTGTAVAEQYRVLFEKLCG